MQGWEWTSCISYTQPVPFVTGTDSPGNVLQGDYRYKEDLLVLKATATGQGPKCFRPATPLKVPTLESALRDHPDKQFVQYILSGICKGVYIGVVRPTHYAQQRTATCHQCRVSRQWSLSTSRTRSWQAGYWDDFLNLSPIGLIPKPYQPGRWHLIVDLSSPHGQSVNDAISLDICHMTIHLCWRHQQLFVSWAEEQSWPRLTCTRHTEWCQYMQMTTAYWA